LTTVFVVAPVAFHRVLFRQHQRYWLVEASNTTARAGLALLAVTSAGVLFLVFDIIVGTVVAAAVGTLSLLVFATVWIAVPLLTSGRRRR
uniref:DUF6328 family protein n=1 Tax=Nocardioides sp. TaxID=35761 RepID=UPI002B2777A0